MSAHGLEPGAFPGDVRRLQVVRHMISDDPMLARRQREHDQREAERKAREAAEEEERERRLRAPVPVGNGRVFRGLVR